MTFSDNAGAEPLWRPRRLLIAARIPARMYPWLFDTSSLTQRVIHACRGTFRVEVIRQAWRRPMRNEAFALGLRPDAYALVREVHLRCAEVPWVYARTVIPRATLVGLNRRLARLGARSLGDVLFADPSLERGEVEVGRTTAADKLYARATQALFPPPAELWGRRTMYSLGNRPLLVSEVFLPALPDFPDAPARPA